MYNSVYKLGPLCSTTLSKFQSICSFLKHWRTCFHPIQTLNLVNFVQELEILNYSTVSPVITTYCLFSSKIILNLATKNDSKTPTATIHFFPKSKIQPYSFSYIAHPKSWQEHVLESSSDSPNIPKTFGYYCRYDIPRSNSLFRKHKFKNKSILQYY